MKKTALLLLLFPMYQFLNGQIIADHTVVDMYDKIPQKWVDEVKKMWVSVAGASHAGGYVVGLDLLYDKDQSRPFKKQYSGVPEAYTDKYLRLNTAIRGTKDDPTAWEYRNEQQHWYTNQAARDRIMAYLQYCHDEGLALFATMYGWSFDAQFENPPSGEYDPIYHVRWAGRTTGGPDGSRIWGLDNEDKAITGNSVSMTTYIETVNQYNQYCKNNKIATKVVFTTGSVDNNMDANGNHQGWAEGERGYQQYLKWQYIRDYVNNSSSEFLMDYADILCYSNTGEASTTTWTDNSGTLQTFPIIHPDNIRGKEIGHIGYEGAERLGKAMWWLLARMAGWDGKTVSTTYPESNISKSVVTIDQNGVVEIKSDEDITGTVMSLINISGQTVRTKTIFGNMCQMDITSLPSGTYLVVLALDQPYSKIIVKH